MAPIITHNFNTVRKQMEKAFNKANEEKIKTLKEIVFETFKFILVFSPVDTGLFRSSHEIFIGELQLPIIPETGTIIDETPEGLPGKTLEQGLSRIESITAIPKGGFKIFIVTNLTYSAVLEDRFLIYEIAANVAERLIQKAAA